MAKEDSLKYVFTNLKVNLSSLDEFIGLYVDFYPHIFSSVDPIYKKNKKAYVETIKFILKYGQITNKELHRKWKSHIIKVVPTTDSSLRTWKTLMNQAGMINVPLRATLIIPEVIIKVIKSGSFSANITMVDAEEQST